MSTFDLHIDRLQITVHGVAAGVVEEALAGLESALRRRLGQHRGGLRAPEGGTLRLGPLDLPAGSDATALRELLAGRLLEALQPDTGEVS